MMAIHRLNHAVLYVRDVARSVAFYRDVLGFRVIDDMGGIPGAAFLRAAASTNDHDLGLFEIGDQAAAPSARAVGLYHLAWEVPAAALDAAALDGRVGIRPLDLDREKARYGAATPGGIGISRGGS